MEEKLVLDNIGLIYKCIKDLNCQWKTEDEFQSYYDAGLEGLIKGAKKYDSNISRPATYLYECIKTHILKEFYLSLCDCRKVNKVYKTCIDEYANSKFKYSEIIADTKPSVEKEVEIKLMTEYVLKWTECLCGKTDALIIKKLYGLDGEKEHKAKEIAHELRVTPTYIHKRKRKTLKIIRQIL